jgi:NAD(P)-dependent dehydrogenase (short-subunit alcohol dehydrogenase family)
MNRQVALVTGSSRGIGLAAAVALAREGFSIAVNGAIENEELNEAVETIRAEGVLVVSAPFDVSDIALHGTALDKIEKAIGPLTTLVNNAGVGALERCDILNVTEASYDRCMAINAKAMFFLTQAFAKRMVARPRPENLYCSIVNVTSSNAVAAAIQRAEYCISKAAAAMVSKNWAVRLGEENIAVFDVQPGLIATALTAPVIEVYKQRAKDGLTLFPRVGQPEDIGAVIASLATGRLPYTTGQVISADAGMLVPRI